jgi:hypothetical protein
MMDIENPLPTLQKLSICTLIKAIQGFSKDVRLAEGCISEKAMCRAIIEPIQLTDYDIDYKNNENKYQLQFQFSPNFLLNNYGFLIGGGARLKWQILLPKFEHFADKEKERINANAIDWINACKIQLIRKDEFNVDLAYFNETLDEFIT